MDLMMDLTMNPDVRHEEGKRYYIQLGDQRAELAYNETGRTRDFRHTFVPEELRGRGIAEHLVRHSLDDTLLHGYTFIPTCPYVKRFVQKHPQYRAGLASRKEV